MAGFLSARRDASFLFSLSSVTVLTFSQRQVKGVINLLDLSRFLDALQLVSELPQFDVEVDFVLSSRELSTASAG